MSHGEDDPAEGEISRLSTFFFGNLVFFLTFFATKAIQAIEG